jgi:hypothetical protein
MKRRRSSTRAACPRDGSSSIRSGSRDRVRRKGNPTYQEANTPSGQVHPRQGLLADETRGGLDVAAASRGAEVSIIGCRPWGSGQRSFRPGRRAAPGRSRPRSHRAPVPPQAATVIRLSVDRRQAQRRRHGLRRPILTLGRRADPVRREALGIEGGVRPPRWAVAAVRWELGAV